VSYVVRQHGLTAAELFQLGKAYLEGFLVAVGANEAVWSTRPSCKRPCGVSNNLKVLWAARLWRIRFSRRLWTLPKQKVDCALACIARGRALRAEGQAKN
jgi:hypothetical protein